MPVSVQFIDRKTNEAIPLKDLDDLICAHVEATPDESEMHWIYGAMGMFGIGALNHSGGFELTEEAFKAHAERCELDMNMLDIYKKFMIDDFLFRAWR